MIYLSIVAFVACIGLAGYVAGLNARLKNMQAELKKRCDHNFDYVMRVEGNLISMSQHVAELEKSVETNSDEHKGEELEKLLEKKWEDAIQTISNFDPFRVGEDK